MSVINPTGNNELLGEAVAMRKIGRFERFLGPDNYRVMQGLLKTPASVAGSILILLFVIVALASSAARPTGEPKRSLSNSSGWVQVTTSATGN